MIPLLALTNMDNTITLNKTKATQNMQLNQLFFKYHKTFTIIIDLLLVSFSFLVLAWAKPATIRIVLPQYTAPFLIYSIIWVIISFVMGKYDLNNFKKPIHLMVTITIITFIILSIVSILLFALKLNAYSRAIVFGTIVLCYFLEIITFRIIYGWVRVKIKKNDKKIVDGDSQVTINHEPVPVINKQDVIRKVTKEASTREKLIAREAGAEVYNYLKEHLNINDSSVNLSATTTPFNIENLNGENLLGIVNLKKVNDMRYINKFFEAVNSKLHDAGLYIGCVETSSQRYKRIGKRYPAFIRQFVIIIDFIINRILPRLSSFKNIYFNITAGVKRTISKAEVLGRLVSCGFEIIEYKEINNLTYFVAMKTGEPAFNPNPSYGPLFKMPRIGKNGDIIFVYKFRTMHPFSEYLQDYVLRLNGYSVVGKPADDFRLTKWGKFMRKYWLDELPQLINVLKGEMKLVGIRPLSKRAFSEYPDDVKRMRVKYKPGCIPPYVALLKQGMQQSIEAERTYLQEKEKNPLTTDIKYFKLAILNIVTNKIRSA
jgi:lipopolysaccharide/colanic/teichoic acid biosynthesis glycosyltransferase